MVMDTGGWESKPDGISIGVSLSAELAMKEADVLLLVVDSQVGALDEDDVLVQELRKMKKPIILIANKVDGPSEGSRSARSLEFGLGEPHFVSALHGRGSGFTRSDRRSRFPKLVAHRCKMAIVALRLLVDPMLANPVFLIFWRVRIDL